MTITYIEAGDDGRPVKKKAPLSHLLDKVNGTFSTTWAETKHADPRELVLKTADRLRMQTELLAKLLGQLKDGPTVNVLISPDWQRLRSVILEALMPYPDARIALAETLAEVESNAIH